MVDDMPTKEDLEAVDLSGVQSLEMLRSVDLHGGTNSTSTNSAERAAELFASTFFVTFTTTTSDDRTVELISNGENIDVTFETRQQYCDLVMKVKKELMRTCILIILQFLLCHLIYNCIPSLCLFSTDCMNLTRRRLLCVLDWPQ